MKKKTFLQFLAIWLIISLLQAYFTELLHDEAYYWVYSKDLAWGYFDHPPLLAVLIKMGYALFKNELGVRLFIALMNTGTLWLIWKIIEGDNLQLFLALACSTVIIHFGGFIAVPDIPLVFFVALFFYFFKRYLAEDQLGNSLGLAIAIIGMAYSKYLGVLVVFFAILPNWQLLKRGSLWAIILAVSGSLVPHFYWQYLNEFPTFRYQFLDRSQVPYKIEFFFNYLLGQLLIFGPFMGFLLFPAAVKYKSISAFDKTMKWCFYGFFGFFLLQSLKGRIEPNWTVMGAIPLLYLSYHFIKNRPKWLKWAYQIVLPSLVLIFVARVYLVYDFLPENWVKRNEFHNWDKWANDLSEAAGDLPVVFHNTFQKPSKYMFYSGKFAHAVNYSNYAGKQYDLMTDVEESLQGKTVFDVYEWGKDTLSLGGIERQPYQIVDNFRYFNRVKIDIPAFSYTVPLDSILPIEVTIRNTTNKPIDFSAFKDQMSIQYCLFWYGKDQFCEKAISDFPIEQLKPLETRKMQLNIRTPKDTGTHWRFRFAINYNGIMGRNSNFTKLKIKE